MSLSTMSAVSNEHLNRSSGSSVFDIEDRFHIIEQFTSKRRDRKCVTCFVECRGMCTTLPFQLPCFLDSQCFGPSSFQVIVNPLKAFASQPPPVYFLGVIRRLPTSGRSRSREYRSTCSADGNIKRRYMLKYNNQHNALANERNKVRTSRDSTYSLWLNSGPNLFSSLSPERITV
jgi:hypothetical protein